MQAYNIQSDEDDDAISDGKASNDSFCKDYVIPKKVIEIEK
jgi:hypothetical protein